MEKIINKIKTEEILNFIDLKKVAYYLLDDNTTLVKEGVEPYYNVTKNEIVLNNKTTSPWFLSEFIEYYKGYKIANILTDKEKEKLCKIKQCHKPALYNYILLNAVAHEVRHSNQNNILLNDFENYDYDFLKTLLQVKLKNNMTINTMCHDFLYHEYDADMFALKFINDLNEELKLDEIKEYNRYAAYKILRGYLSTNRYEISNPLKNTNEILEPIDNNMLIMKCLEENYEYLKGIINCYDGYKYFELFKYLNNYKKTQNDDFESRISRGDYLEKDELKLIKNIYVGNIKCDNLKTMIKEKTHERL